MTALHKLPIYETTTKLGFTVRTEVRAHDKNVVVIVEHEGDLIKLEPVATEEELKQWFWKYVEDFGGEEDG